jgi:hypothetical protein
MSGPIITMHSRRLNDPGECETTMRLSCHNSRRASPGGDAAHVTVTPRRSAHHADRDRQAGGPTGRRRVDPVDHWLEIVHNHRLVTHALVCGNAAHVGISG